MQEETEADILPTGASGAPALANAAMPPPDAAPAPRADASVILQPIALEETRGKLPEELGCAFAASDDPRAHVILIGKAFVGGSKPPMAAVKVDGRVSILTGERGGGYALLTRGTVFSGGSNLTVIVHLRSDEGGQDDFESQSWIADLTVRSGEGNSRTYSKGRWTCSP